MLERIGGIVDVKGDEDVLMLYTSFAHQTDSALIWVYGPDAQAIAIGSTSGPDSDPRFVRLNWLAFSRDVIVANRTSRTRLWPCTTYKVAFDKGSCLVSRP